MTGSFMVCFHGNSDLRIVAGRGFARREITRAIERYLFPDDPHEDEEGDTPDGPHDVRAGTRRKRTTNPSDARPRWRRGCA
jgi:hypothetical protein